MDIKIQQNNLCDYAYNRIKALILNDALKSGEKIVQEKMAEKLGMSKIPIIQALTLLQNERLIEYFPRRGFFVKELSNKEFIEILDIRSKLEGLAVEIIIQNMNNSFLNKLTEILKKFEFYRSIQDHKKYFELDKKFHYLLIEASKNYYLININNTFNILLLCYTRGFRTKIDVSIEHHRRIINAILSKETEKAVSLIREHTERKKESHFLDKH
ncbi:MAG: GntR family transcriptional regulator [Candidatus Humimicrobiaceae bacterium]